MLWIKGPHLQGACSLIRTLVYAANRKRNSPSIFLILDGLNTTQWIFGALHLETSKEVIANAGITSSDIAAIGITNQRETTLIWDRKTGLPIYNAIVWQDRRTAALCTELKRLNHEALVSEKTGLLLDPYFSATKIAWILDNIPNARPRAERGELAFGTVDTWLLWNLTDGQSHATDATNASRTLLYNIHSGQWDDDLLDLFNVPRQLLPEVKDSAADFGSTELFGKPIKIYGIAGDQHAATIGSGMF